MVSEATKIKDSKNNVIIYYLSLLGFFAIFSTTISKNPVLPLFAHSLGASDSLLGIISFFSPFAGIVFSFPIGFLIDRIGQKRLLIISATFFLIAPLLYSFVWQPLWLIPIRFLHGMATAILNPLATTIIVNSYFQNKGEKLGYYSSATLFGRTLAPLLGGVVISALAFLPGAWNYRAVYWVAFIMAIPVFVLAVTLKKDHYEDRREGGPIHWRLLLTALKNFVGNGRLFSTSLMQMSIYFTFGVLETFLPGYLIWHGFSASQIGLIFSLQIVAMAIFQPLFGKIADRVDKRWQIVAGVLILGGVTALITVPQNHWLIASLSVAFGVGMSLATVATGSYVADMSKKEERGSAMGALSAIMDVGHSFGPLLTGFIITWWSVEKGFLFSLAVCVLVSLFFIIANFRKTVKI